MHSRRVTSHKESADIIFYNIEVSKKQTHLLVVYQHLCETATHHIPGVWVTHTHCSFNRWRPQQDIKAAYLLVKTFTMCCYQALSLPKWYYVGIKLV